MNDFELKINEGSIQTNLDTLKTELSEVASRYKGVVVTEDTISVAKTDLANLRKLSKEVDDKRKSVKKQWEVPLKKFETEVKSALEIIQEPIDAINKQLTSFEENRKKERLEEVKKIYEDAVGEFKDFVTFDSVYSDKWLNKSTTDKDIQADISVATTNARAGIDAIKVLNSEIEDTLMETFKKSGLAAAIQKNSDYLYTKALAEKKVAEEQAKKEEVIEPVVETVNEEPKKYYATYTVRAKTEEESENLRQMLEFNNYEFSVIY